MYIYQDLSHTARVALLRKTCKTKESITYSQTLSPTELAEEEKIFARDAMRISQLEDELKQMTSTYKGQINALKKTSIERLEVLSNEKRQVYGPVYGIADHVGGRMLFYDENGEMVMSRELHDRERQNSLFIGQEGEETASADEATTAANILDQFGETQLQDAEFEPTEPEYEPTFNEEAPDESDLKHDESNDVDSNFVFPDDLDKINQVPDEEAQPEGQVEPEPVKEPVKKKRAPKKK